MVQTDGRRNPLIQDLEGQAGEDVRLRAGETDADSGEVRIAEDGSDTDGSQDGEVRADKPAGGRVELDVG